MNYAFSTLDDVAFSGGLITVGAGGLTVNPGTVLNYTFSDFSGNGLTALPRGPYELMYDSTGGDFAGVNLANFNLSGLPALPAGEFYTLTTAVNPGYIDLDVVPEPGTLALLAAGFLGLLGYAWRRRTAA